MADHKIPAITVETPLGPMNAHFHNSAKIVFTQRTDQVLTVNRVEYRCYFTAELKDGTWQVAVYDNGRQSTLNLNRADSHKAFDYTFAAVEKAEKVLGEWLPKWAAEQTLLLAEAEVNAAKREYETASAKVDAAYKAVEEANAEEEAAINRCDVAEKRLLSLRTLVADSEVVSAVFNSFL